MEELANKYKEELKEYEKFIRKAIQKIEELEKLLEIEEDKELKNKFYLQIEEIKKLIEKKTKAIEKDYSKLKAKISELIKGIENGLLRTETNTKGNLNKN